MPNNVYVYLNLNTAIFKYNKLNYKTAGLVCQLNIDHKMCDEDVCSQERIVFIPD